MDIVIKSGNEDEWRLLRNDFSHHGHLSVVLAEEELARNVARNIMDLSRRIAVKNVRL